MARKKPATRVVSIPSNVLGKENPDPFDAGQSGDLQGLPGSASANSESVRELIEEGQAFEAGIVDGVENAPPADVAEVTVRETRADDVPTEYDQENDEPKE